MPLERTLPRDAYFADAIWQREKERIFGREWACAGRAEELPAPGDYRVLDLAGESLLVVRTKAGALRAFYNVCRHRGCRLVLDPPATPHPAPAGHFAGGIRCPYHAWTYTLDGELRTAPFLEEEDGFRREDFPLWPVGVETWGGFFFVNLSPLEAAAEGRTLLQQLGAVPERLSRYPLAELRTAQRISYDVGANWKVLLENYNECYHCAGVHPELCKVVPAFKQKGGSQLDWDRGIPHREGAWTFTRSGTTSRAPFAGLNDDERTRHKGELIYPNFLLSLSAEHVAAFTLWPHGAEHTTIICDFLFHPDEMATPGFDPSDAVEFWDLVNRQDWRICEGVQAGMRARVFEHGYYAPMESASLDIRRYVRERLGDIFPA
ncbi:MAG TPA: aromatic ring-hydroxylating dioxygenase subunit alpha [Gemmatimonadales bacterium]|nr:aromatic ring-hydroxylating dioxygenase subunit alpha [Gemmatimonadales bacterium]